jgi:hypothetical protein
MQIDNLRILETIAVIVLYIVLFFITKTIINTALKNAHLQRTRRKIIIKAVHLFTSLAALTLIAGIWGLKQNEIALFVAIKLLFIQLKCTQQQTAGVNFINVLCTAFALLDHER